MEPGAVYNNAGGKFAVQGVLNNTGTLSIHVHEGSSTRPPELPWAKEAAFNSNAQLEKPTCFEKTRLKVREDIEKWISDGQSTFFWLKGGAGTGKSTIARTIANHYHRKKDEYFLGTFFFSQDNEELSHAGLFFTTIAIQLGKRSLEFHQHLQAAISRSQDITTSYASQLDEFILDPFENLKRESLPTLILVIDSLDECTDSKGLGSILRLLVQNSSFIQAKLRVLITSREESHIKIMIDDWPGDVCQSFSLDAIKEDTEKDISAYIREEMQGVNSQGNICTPDSQDDKTIQNLTEKAGGLFIHAATMTRFIKEDSRLSLQARLELIDNGELDGNSIDGLNKMYEKILQNSRHFEDDDFPIMIGSIAVAFEPLSREILATLCSGRVDFVDEVLTDLSAVLKIQNPGSLVSLYHHSFRDFFRDRGISKTASAYITREKTHETLARRTCIEVMQRELKRDICELKTPNAWSKDLKASQIERFIRRDIKYACTHWASHLQKGQIQFSDNDVFHIFLETHLLHWLEVMALSGDLVGALNSLQVLESIASTSDCVRLHAFISDAKRFVTRNQWLFETFPLQIYISAIIFSPENSIVRRVFGSTLIPAIRKVPTPTETEWGPLLRTIENTFTHNWSGISYVGLSHRADVLSSATIYGEMQLWDVATGKMTYQTHIDALYRNTTFSANGKYAASLVERRKVRFRETEKYSIIPGQEFKSSCWLNCIAFSPTEDILAIGGDKGYLYMFSCEGHKLQVLWNAKRQGVNIETLAFSPDGKFLASGPAPDQNTVQIRDPKNGNLLYTFKSSEGKVRSIAICSRYNYLIEAVGDKILVWEIFTGMIRHTFESHDPYPGRVFFTSVVVSPNGLLISGSNEGKLYIWDIGSGACLQMIDAHAESINSLSLVPRDNGLLLASGSSDRTIKLWDPEINSSNPKLFDLQTHSHKVKQVEFHLGGAVIISIAECSPSRLDNTIKMWDGRTGGLIQTVKSEHGAFFTEFACSSNTNLIASVSNDTVIDIWACTPDALYHVDTLIQRPGANILRIAFSPDGKLLATISKSIENSDAVRPYNLTLWSLKDRKELYCRGNFKDLIALKFSVDSKILACVEHNKPVMLLDSNNGQLIRNLDGEISTRDDEMLDWAPLKQFKDIPVWRRTGALWCRGLEFSPDNRLVALALSNDTVNLWECETGKLLRQFGVNRNITRTHSHHQYRRVASKLYFSPDSVWLHTEENSFLCRSKYTITSTFVAGIPYIHEKWLLIGGERILRFPDSYTPYSFDVFGDRIVIGDLMGRVSLLEFDSRAPNPTQGQSHGEKVFAKSMREGGRSEHADQVVIIAKKLYNPFKRQMKKYF